MTFRNPANGHTENGGSGWSILWALIFGWMYFAVNGVWAHAAISLVLALATVGLSHFVYCWFAPGIVNRAYLRAGWAPAQ